MVENYLSAENLSKSFGEQLLFENLTIGLAKGDKTALVARNGAGKTTLLRILMGKMEPDSGEIAFRNGLRTAFLEQVPRLDEKLSIDKLIFSANSEVLEAIQAYEKALKSNEGLEEATNRMDQLHGWDYERRLKQLLDLFHIIDTTQVVGTLSGGERKRLALALVLLDEPDLLILDEPTNHLDIDMIEWLERYLSSSNLTLLMVTHDRYFLDKLTDHLFVFEGDGRIRDYYRSYTSYHYEQESGIKKSAVSDASKRNKKVHVNTRKEKVPKTKLSYREQQEYERLEPEIGELEKEREALEEEMGSGKLDFSELELKSKRVAEIIELVDQKMERWLELGLYT